MYQQQIQNYFESLKNKKIDVVGIGVSHLPLIKLLASKGAVVTACDKRTDLGQTETELRSLGVKLVLGDHYMDDLNGDIIFKTPGLRFDHPALLAAEKRGSTVTSEMEVFFELCPCKIIAVTGSDGKTTTTTLISEMMKASGYTVHLGGNIGKPLLPEVESIRPEDFAVVELSSFQLHTMKRSPHIAVVTNLSPNHLDMHKGMDEYVDAKKNILRYQNKDDIVILNNDNDITRSFAAEASGEVRLFSYRTQPAHGVFYRDGAVYNALGETAVKILDRKDIKIPGDHNVENYMAAIAAVRDFVTDEVICSVARSFGGVQHRNEFVREVSGIQFYNDSIGSSPTRTLATLRSFDKKVHLLVGGYDKKIPFDEFGKSLPQYVKALYLSGHTAGSIRKAVCTAPNYSPELMPIFEFEDYKQAVKAAYENADGGDIVVLSPACASFDKFKNFEERGNYFVSCVKELKEKCKE